MGAPRTLSNIAVLLLYYSAQWMIGISKTYIKDVAEEIMLYYWAQWMTGIRQNCTKDGAQ